MRDVGRAALDPCARAALAVVAAALVLCVLAFPAYVPIRSALDYLLCLAGLCVFGLGLLLIELALGALGSLLARRPPPWIAVVTIWIAPPAAYLLARWRPDWNPSLRPLALELVLGVLLGVAVSAAALRLMQRLATPALAGFACSVACVPIALLLWLHIHESTLQHLEAGSAHLRLGVFAATWIAAIASTPLLALRCTVLWGARARDRWTAMAGLGSAIGAALALVADRSLLTGLYPGFHMWLQGMALLLGEAALCLLPPQLPSRTLGSRRLGVAAAAALLLGATFYELSPIVGDARVRATLSRSAYGPALLGLRSPAPLAADPDAVKRTFDVSPYQVPEAADHDWNAILLSIDTLRHDSLSADPRRTPHMPYVSALARESVLFERAYSPSVCTRLALGALLAGRGVADMPWRQLVLHGGRYLDREQADARGLPADLPVAVVPRTEALVMVAQRFRDAGLSTLAVVYTGDESYFGPGHGYEQGFDHDRYFPHTAFARGLGLGRVSTPELVDAALAQLDRVRGRRFFLWLHLFDPHDSGLDRVRYAELMRETDRGVERLMRGLSQRGLRDTTAIALVSDHGEGFGEHGTHAHGNSTYDEVARVPMVLVLPGTPPASVPHTVSTLDAVTTLLALAGGELSGLQGINLLPVVRGERAYPRQRPIITWLSPAGARDPATAWSLASVTIDNWKLIANRNEGAFWLYDLDADPWERQSLVTREPARVAEAASYLGLSLDR